MSLYKVWCASREKKKCLVALNFKDLAQKGKAKLDIVNPSTRIVLEECGTEIEGDDELKFNEGKTLMFLQPGEIWTPLLPTADTSDTGTSMKQSLVNNNLKDYGEQMTPSSEKTACTAESSDRNDLTCSQSVIFSANTMRIDSRTPLPPFSAYLLQHLRQNDAKFVWGKIIHQAAEYYLTQNPCISESSEYQSIGQKMYTSYPAIGHDGATPWTLFCKDLSQRIRWIRWNKKKKSATMLDTTSEPPVKIFKLSEDEKDEDEVTKADYQKHIEEIKKEYSKKNPNDKELKVLLKETHTNRVAWIRGLVDGRIKPILNEFPVFEFGGYVMYEFGLLSGKEKVKEMTQNVVRLCEVIEKLTGKSKAGPLRMLPVIEYLEKHTSFDKGKGIKSKSIITVREDVSEAEKEKICKTKQMESPRVIVFLENGQLGEISIVGDESEIFTQAETVLDSIVALFAVYYIFDLAYPRPYSQLLGLLQEYTMNEPYTGQKSKKFLHMAKTLNQHIRK